MWWILSVLILLNFIILFLLIPLISKKNSQLINIMKLERKIELLVDELDKKLKELEITKEQVIYEKDKAIEEIKNLSFEIERKIKMAYDLLRKNETERKSKLELAKQLIKKGKKAEEISSELQIPLSEVKFIKELLEKQLDIVEKANNV